MYPVIRLSPAALPHRPTKAPALPDRPRLDTTEQTGLDGFRRSARLIQQLQLLLAAGRHAELRVELSRAEIAGELSEFHALRFHAVLAIADGCHHASDYLEMAEAVAETPHERAVLAELLASYELRRGDPVAAAERCVATLEHVHQTEGLWVNLLVALDRLGDFETIDATLRGFAHLHHDQTTLLVHLLWSEPELRGVRARPACQSLLDRRAAG